MTYISTCLADGAVGLYGLGEALFASAAADQTANSNGTYVNSTGITLGQTGIAGGAGATACLFTAANFGEVTIPDVAAQHVGDTFTMETWVKVASLPASYADIFTGSANGPELVITSTGAISLSKGNVAAVVASTSTLSADSTFHHVAVTKATTTTKLYIDGVDKTGTVTNQTMANAAGYFISRAPFGSGSPFNGTQQFVALYPTAITAAKVTVHYRLGANLVPVNTVAPVASGSTTIGSVVTTTNGTWTDAGSPTFTYQWKRNGTPIGGATSSTYTLVAADDAATILCTVTDTDVVGATSANSNALTDTTPIPAAVTVDDLASIYAAHISQN